MAHSEVRCLRPPILLLGLVLACSKEAASRPRPAGLAALPPDPAALLDDIENVPEAPPAGQTISGTIVLPRARRGDVTRGDTIFVAVRRSDGQPGPASLLAAQKLSAEDFPLPFTLSARDAMIPGVPFQGKVSITVRVDKDGDPLTRRKGDVHGQADGVEVGAQNVVVSLDRLQADDVTLGSAGLLDQADGQGRLPPGHPPLP
jgi:hypothetical protein